jgi:hypothetical protein
VLLVLWVLLSFESGTDHLAALTEDRSLVYAGFAGVMAVGRAGNFGDPFAPLLAQGAGSGSRR